MAAYAPLHEPGTPTVVHPVELSLAEARKVLSEQQPANIHDDKAMLAAAVHLQIALRDLVASLDAEGGKP